MIRRLIKHITPRWALALYHALMALGSAALCGFPSHKLLIIGVTGTNGKSTVVSIIGQLLHGAGKRVGWISTATIRVGDKETLNATKLTTPSPVILHRALKRMVAAGCTHAVLEASSEGLAQGRLNGIDPQIAVFTNLTPEHIESHGSFERYAQAKERLFAKLATAHHRGKPTVIVANTDDEHAGRYLSFPADVKIGCSLGASAAAASGAVIFSSILLGPG